MDSDGYDFDNMDLAGLARKLKLLREEYETVYDPEYIEKWAELIRNEEAIHKQNYTDLIPLEMDESIVVYQKYKEELNISEKENEKESSSNLGHEITKSDLNQIAENIAIISNLILDEEDLEYYKLDIGKGNINAKLKQGILEIENSGSPEEMKKGIREAFVHYRNPEVDHGEMAGHIEDRPADDLLSLVTINVYAGILSVLPNDFQNFEAQVELFKPVDNGGISLNFSKGNQEYRREYNAEELLFFWAKSKREILNSDISNGETVNSGDILMGSEIYIDYEELCEERLDNIDETSLTRWEQVEEMDGIEFEHFLRDLFDSMGYKVEVTEASNDQGADLIVERKTSKIVVQAKKYTGNVSNSAVQETVGAINYYDAERGIVVTTGGFTESAEELAESNNVDLWEESRLKSKIEKYLEN